MACWSFRRRPDGVRVSSGSTWRQHGVERWSCRAGLSPASTSFRKTPNRSPVASDRSASGNSRIAAGRKRTRRRALANRSHARSRPGQRASLAAATPAADFALSTDALAGAHPGAPFLVELDRQPARCRGLSRGGGLGLVCRDRRSVVRLCRGRLCGARSRRLWPSRRAMRSDCSADRFFKPKQEPPGYPSSFA